MMYCITFAFRAYLIGLSFSLYFRADRMAQLLDERDLGVLTSSMSLLVALVSNHHDSYWSCLPKCVKILERLARNQDIPQEYTYYGIPSPWLQVCNMYILFYSSDFFVCTGYQIKSAGWFIFFLPKQINLVMSILNWHSSLSLLFFSFLNVPTTPLVFKASTNCSQCCDFTFSWVTVTSPIILAP